MHTDMRHCTGIACLQSCFWWQEEKAMDKFAQVVESGVAWRYRRCGENAWPKYTLPPARGVVYH